MSSPADAVDRDRAERRRDLLAAPLLVTFFAGIVLLTGRFGLWTGGAAWTAIGILLPLAGLALRLPAEPAAARQDVGRVPDPGGAAAHADPGRERPSPAWCS